MKRILILGIVLMGLFSLIGCSGDPTDGDDNPVTVVAEQYRGIFVNGIYKYEFTANQCIGFQNNVEMERVTAWTKGDELWLMYSIGGKENLGTFHDVNTFITGSGSTYTRQQ